MKIYLLKFKMLVLASLLIGGSSHLAAHKFEEYLERVEKKFLAARSKEEKFKLVTQPVNREVLCQDDVDLDDEKALSANIDPTPFAYDKEFNFEKKTNPLMLAIGLGEVRLFELFLSVVEDVNDPLLTVWGHRQPYYLAHMALAPALDHRRLSLKKKAPLAQRLSIIDLLGGKNADFNQKLPAYFAQTLPYNNPPLIVPEVGAYSEKFSDALRARALLYGADPLVQGSSASLVCVNPTPERPLNSFGINANRFCALAFDKYLKMPPEQQKNVRLAESVKEKFKELKVEKLKQLANLEF